MHSILSFRITKGATRLVSPDLGHTCVWLSLLPVFSGCPVYVNTHWASRRSKAPVTFVHKFKNTCNEHARSKVHVIIHGYNVKVLDVNIYIYIYIYIYTHTQIMSIYYINNFAGIWNRLWINRHYSLTILLTLYYSLTILLTHYTTHSPYYQLTTILTHYTTQSLYCSLTILLTHYTTHSILLSLY